MRKSIILWLVLVCFIASPAIVFASDFSDRINGLVKVQGVRVYSNGDRKVRVVLDSSGPVEYKTFVLSNPNRIAVDIKGAWLSPTVDKVTMVDGGLVGKVRISQFDPTTVRVVVEANVSKDRYQVFQLKENPAADKSNRIVMDFGDLAQEETPKAATVEESTITTVPDADKVVTKTIKLFDAPGLKDKIIAIDPGHGGSDAGAVGLKGVKEKEVTLAVGLELKKMLEAEGATVIMTRKSDVDVAYANASAKDELQARADIANNAHADVFVSIHMDAFVNTQAKGTSTYYYPKTNGDERIAKFVREGLVSQLGTDDRSTRTCNFYVVKHTTMPATLAEVVFISNPTEEQLVKSAEGAKKAATGIFRGLDRYFSYE